MTQPVPSNSDAVRNVVGRRLMGFTTKDGRIELVFGGDRELIIEGWLREDQPGLAYTADLQAHYCGPPPRRS